MAPLKVPVPGTWRCLSTCSWKGGSADRLLGSDLSSPGLWFLPHFYVQISLPPPLPRIGGGHVGFDWIRALGRVLELEQQQQKSPLDLLSVPMTSAWLVYVNICSHFSLMPGEGYIKGDC